MRLSAEPVDPGYAALDAMRARGREPEILLDGVMVDGGRVVWADDIAGQICCYVVDEKGRLKVEGEHAVMEILSGRVQIIERPAGRQ